MKEIPLTQGMFALVDDEDFERVSTTKWCIAKRGSTIYAVHHVLKKSKETIEYMHRFLLEAKRGQCIDHVNGDGLDNRRQNLRIATKAQNGHNHGPLRTNKSGYKGVSWSKHAKRWTVFIGVNGKTINCGYFVNKHSAARAYNEVALKYHGEFAWLNKITS